VLDIGNRTVLAQRGRATAASSIISTGVAVWHGDAPYVDDAEASMRLAVAIMVDQNAGSRGVMGRDAMPSTSTSHSGGTRHRARSAVVAREPFAIAPSTSG